MLTNKAFIGFSAVILFEIAEKSLTTHYVYLALDYFVAFSMDYNIFTTIGSVIVFGVWLFIAYMAIRAYGGLLKQKGISSFMTRQQLNSITNPETVKRIQGWNRLIKRLFILWVVTVVVYFLIFMIIEKTIGFNY